MTFLFITFFTSSVDNTAIVTQVHKNKKVKIFCTILLLRSLSRTKVERSRSFYMILFQRCLSCPIVEASFRVSHGIQSEHTSSFLKFSSTYLYLQCRFYTNIYIFFDIRHNMLSTVGSDRSCRTYNSKSMKLVKNAFFNYSFKFVNCFNSPWPDEQDVQVHAQHGGLREEQIGCKEE